MLLRMICSPSRSDGSVHAPRSSAHMATRIRQVVAAMARSCAGPIQRRPKRFTVDVTLVGGEIQGFGCCIFNKPRVCLARSGHMLHDSEICDHSEAVVRNRISKDRFWPRLCENSNAPRSRGSLPPYLSRDRALRLYLRGRFSHRRFLRHRISRFHTASAVWSHSLSDRVSS